jgi:hypothetical protein
MNTVQFLLRSKMSLPPDDSRHFRNTCIEIKKNLRNTKDVNKLQDNLERFVTACHHVHWPHETSSVFHVEENERLTQKFIAEFERYINDLAANRPANPQNTLDALDNVETVIDQLKVKEA